MSPATRCERRRRQGACAPSASWRRSPTTSSTTPTASAATCWPRLPRADRRCRLPQPPHVRRPAAWACSRTPREIIEAQPASTAEEQERIVERLRRLPQLVDQTIDNLRAGVDAGLTPPQICLRDVPQQIRNQIVADAFDSPLLVPFVDCDDDRVRRAPPRRTPASPPPTSGCTSSSIDTYLPAARSSIACRDLPDGEARYAHAVRHHTTTDLTPDEIHEIGLAEVARIRTLMEQVAKDAGYDGFDGLHRPTCARRPSSTTPRRRRCWRATARSAGGSMRTSRSCSAGCRRCPTRSLRVPPYAEQSQTAAYYLPPAPGRVAPGPVLRQHLRPAEPLHLGDGGAHAARGGARSPPADRAGPGADRAARVPAQRLVHRLRRRVGAVRREPRSRGRLLPGPVPALWRARPARSGGPCGSCSTPGCTTSAGRGSGHRVLPGR